MSPKIVVFSPMIHVLFSAFNMLSSQGFQITVMRQHPSSLKEIAYFHPDVLIVDNKSVFSQMTVEIVKALKANRRLASIPVLCTIAADQQRELAHLSGVAVFTTPLHTISLLDWVRAHVGRIGWEVNFK